MTALAGVATLAIFVVSELLASALGLSAGLGLRSTGLFLSVMVVVIYGSFHHHPFPKLGAANYVTTVRTVLVAFVAALVPETPDPTVAWTGVVVASIAATLDGWDGWLARRSRMESAFGARFDMEVDALLILVLGAFAWRHDKAGSWVLLSGALRYLFILAGLGLPWFNRPLPPSTRRKAVCVIQIVALIVAIGPIITPPLSAIIAAASLALLAWSFGVDTWWLWRAHRPEALA